ncbi:MAG: hypothetical protein WD716_14170 [Fimbriimonadaceae bacterium]
MLAFFGLASLAIAVPVGVAYAQQSDQRTGQVQSLPPQRAGQETRPDVLRRDQAPTTMRMGGGPATMVVDNAFLYVLQGNHLYRVNKNTLEVVGQGMLPMQMGYDPLAPSTAGPRRGGGEPPTAGVRGGGDLPPEGEGVR